MIVQPLDFEKLVGAIHQVHAELATQASRAVNVSLTLRNWMIGCYITEYEQNGANRAKYGERLRGRLSESLSPKGVNRVEERELRRYRQFYQTYPQIRETVSPELHQRLLGSLATGDIEKRESATPEFFLPGKELIGRLSFGHTAGSHDQKGRGPGHRRIRPGRPLARLRLERGDQGYVRSPACLV